MTNIYIVGIGMTSFGKYLNRSVKQMTSEAVNSAINDAECKLSDIDIAYFSNAAQSVLEGQATIPGQIALRTMGLQSVPIVNVENACASASTALDMASTWLKAGRGGIALAVGAEKMFHEDRDKMFSVFDGGWDIHNSKKATEALLHLGVGVDDPDVDNDDNAQRSIFMDVYAALAKYHMKCFGTTQEQIAAVSAKNHEHSQYNYLSQYQKAISIEEVLAARKVSWPLTLPMCSPISDGAAAAIICREDELYRFDSKKAVKIEATVLRTGSDRKPEEFTKHITHVAAQQAYEESSLGPDDMDLAEVHDATAFAEIQQIENLGFCEFGEGGHMSISGETRIGGNIPINPSGGLESKGHPIGATGLAQIYELVAQLRGDAGKRQVEGARFGIAENGGGFHGVEEAVACLSILSRC
ncbi:MAG: thiolase [Rhodospirillaceae bacterium]|nr:thiolase [Rhodospirillaceae bacterium]|tara:strand:+ start:9482 stop:10720 length:1239 start_codon:yes stop_codon:yes gene_type:complete